MKLMERIKRFFVFSSDEYSRFLTTTNEKTKEAGRRVKEDQGFALQAAKKIKEWGDMAALIDPVENGWLWNPDEPIRLVCKKGKADEPNTLTCKVDDDKSYIEDKK